MEHESRLDISDNVGHDFKFNWTIPNFKNIPGGKLSSPLPTSDKCSLKLQLILKVNFGPTRKLKIGLSKCHLEPQDFNVFFYYEFCDIRGEIFCKGALEILFTRNEQEIFSPDVTKPTRATSEPNTARNFYQISVKGHVVVKQCCKTVEMDVESKNEAVAQLQQDFEERLLNGENADIVLDVGEEQFRVHKFVLCARSPVYRKMFSHDMSESRHNSIRIDDVDVAVFKNFLTFLYTGEIGRLSFDATCELYSVGDRYEVWTLLSSCRHNLISHLSDKTVSRILKLADMHNDQILEEKAGKFVCVNFKAVSENQDWKTLILDSPFLVSRTLEKVSNYLSVLIQ